MQHKKQMKNSNSFSLNPRFFFRLIVELIWIETNSTVGWSLLPATQTEVKGSYLSEGKSEMHEWMEIPFFYTFKIIFKFIIFLNVFHLIIWKIKNPA